MTSTKVGLKKIGKSPPDSKRRVYQAELKQIYHQENGRVKGEIGVLDPNDTNLYEADVSLCCAGTGTLSWCLNTDPRVQLVRFFYI